jgi:selenocysteine lyase/cysteine desulfurase
VTDVPTFDRTFARAQFPAYDEGNPLADLAFFEAAGGSFPCRQVVERLTRFYTESKVQPGHPYVPALGAWEQMESTYARLATWMGVTPDEVLVGPSTTANTYTLAGALREILGPGDALVITDQAHEANAGPYDRLRDAGIDVRTWSCDPETGALDLEQLDVVLDADVAAVAFPHVSNLLGDPLDVAAACERIHDAGALAIVDGVAAAPHGLPWVDDTGADIYLFSSYKTYGPHQGVMVVREDAMEQLPNQGHYFNAEQPHKRLVPAGPDHAQVAALQGVVDYLELLDGHHFGEADAAASTRNHRLHDLLRAAETETLTPLLSFLDGHDAVRVLGPTDPTRRVPTVAMQLDRDAATIARQLGERGVAAAAGHFYSHRLTAAMGLDPSTVLRLSFTHTTAPWEIDRAITELTDLLGR